jgi:N-acetylmuramoyl-L-alanine amidase
LKVLLEAGHGGKDPGACKGSRREADDTLRMALAVGKLLKEQGISVGYTRIADLTFNLDTLPGMANGYDLTVSIHRNSATATATGIEVLYRYDNSLNAAKTILQELYGVTPVAQRGVKQFNYQGFSQVKKPAVLVELLFISNNKDNQLFDKYFGNYALAIAKGIVKTLGVTWREKEEDDDMVRYEKIEDVPEWGLVTVKKLIDKKALAMPADGKINLSEDMLRIFVINDRMGLYN